MKEEPDVVLCPDSEPDDETLVGAVLAGNVALFTPLVTRHTQRLYGLALRLLGDSEEAEDATQEAFIRAYAQLASFRGSASFATWLYRITLNVCRDQLRRRQVRQRTAELARVDQLWADERYTVDPERVVLALEDRQVLEQALHHLPATFRGFVRVACGTGPFVINPTRSHSERKLRAMA